MDVQTLDDLPREEATGFRRFLQILNEYKGALIGFLLWFIFLFVRINRDDPQSTEQSLTIGVTLLMIVWWLTETGLFTLVNFAHVQCPSPLRPSYPLSCSLLKASSTQQLFVLSTPTTSPSCCLEVSSWPSYAFSFCLLFTPSRPWKDGTYT